MRCKKHVTDLSAAVGVCATCLRERLFILIEAQAQAQLQRQEHRKSDANPPPPPPQLLFPRSVSPYISRRKSDNSASLPHCHQHRASDQRFYSTPQIGRKKKSSLFSNLFRSRSQKLDLDSSVDLKSSDSYSTANTKSSSPSWFSNIFMNKLKKKSRMYTMSDPSVGSSSNQRPCRGMSPTVESDDDCGDGSSGYTSDNSSQGWKQTPRRAAPVQRRMTNLPRNVSGLAFCLSPLVRASPNRHWNQKGMQPDVVISGENKSPVNPNLGVAAAFCANRSRKVANFGRFHPKY